MITLKTCAQRRLAGWQLKFHRFGCAAWAGSRTSDLPEELLDTCPGAASGRGSVPMTVVLRSAESGHGLALQLRPWGARDIPHLLDIYRDPVMRQSSRNPIVTEQDARRWLEVQQQGWTDGGRLSFAVAGGERGSDPGRVLGNVVLKGWKVSSNIAPFSYRSRPGHFAAVTVVVRRERRAPAAIGQRQRVRMP